jgi:hypothetical protein
MKLLFLILRLPFYLHANFYDIDNGLELCNILSTLLYSAHLFFSIFSCTSFCDLSATCDGQVLKEFSKEPKEFSQLDARGKKQFLELQRQQILDMKSHLAGYDTFV